MSRNQGPSFEFSKGIADDESYPCVAPTASATDLNEQTQAPRVLARLQVKNYT